jgi:3-oxoacyl-[acyl-carrier protein] reductase
MTEKAIPNRVLVTGGGRGIGAAIVRTLAAGGHDVLFTYRTDERAAQALAAEVAAESGRAIDITRLDLADKAAVDGFAEGLAAGDPFYGFVHNAGQPYDTLLALLDQAKAEAIMQVNFFAFTRLAAALVRPMTSRRAGRIVAIASIAALRAGTGNGAYAATKAAMIGYARTLAIETARRGVTVNCVAPGFVDTAMLGSYAAQRENTEGQIPAGRYARAEDVAGVVGFLMSPAAAYVTGTVLPVDGGLSAALAIHR